MFRSEIRDSVVNALLEKAQSKNYSQYLSKMILRKCAASRTKSSTSTSPLLLLLARTAGKNTVLGAAACAYKSVYRKKFFAKSGNYDQSMQDWTTEYELVDKSLNSRDVVRRTASFRNLRWNRDALERQVLIFGVSRTVPVK